MNDKLYDSYDQYIKDIKAIPRITVEREQELARIIQSNSNDKEVEKAVNELVSSNLLLVVKFAREAYERCYSRNKGKSLLMDLIEEGNIALMRAAQLFKPEHVKFSTYASSCIQSKLKRSASEITNLIHIPEWHKKYHIQIAALKREYGENISDDFIISQINISPEMYSKIVEGKKNSSLTMLDGIEEWQDFVCVDPESTTEDVSNKDLREHIMEIVNRTIEKTVNSKRRKVLSERERDVLMSFSFDPKLDTFDTLGKSINISRERVRQIYQKAIRNLKNYLIKDWESRHHECLSMKPKLSYNGNINDYSDYYNQLGVYQKYVMSKVYEHYTSRK